METAIAFLIIMAYGFTVFAIAFIFLIVITAMIGKKRMHRLIKKLFF